MPPSGPPGSSPPHPTRSERLAYALGPAATKPKASTPDNTVASPHLPRLISRRTVAVGAPLLLVGGALTACNSSNLGLALTPEQAVQRVARSTVFVKTDRGTGSGVVLGSGGVVTSLHVVERAGHVTVWFPDKRGAPARVKLADRQRDLAFLDVPTTEAPLPLGDAAGLRPGATLFAVGYPLADVIGSQSATVTRGSFSGLRRLKEDVEDVLCVQTDTAVNPGNSGGPLVDDQGRVVGIVTLGVRGATGLNLAVAANEVRVFLVSESAPVPPPTSTKTATIELEKGGSVTIQLFPDAAPQTVKNFADKAGKGFYDGLTFHRVEDWVVQGGDPRGDGRGGGSMPTELNERPFTVGTVGVARGADVQISNEAQFFICTEPAEWLNKQYTNFGQVTAGMDTVRTIQRGDKIKRISVTA